MWYLHGDQEGKLKQINKQRKKESVAGQIS